VTQSLYVALRTVGVLVLLALCLQAAAVIETYEFSSPALEARYHRLSQELRCPKCQNQNIADSNAPISEDLRRLLYEQLEAGASDEEILDTMVSRYGEFVRYRPAMEGVALWLWLAPALMLAAGLLVLVLLLRRRRDADTDLPAAADDEARRRLDAMLDGIDQESRP
jgi:cytochrome c-type biogenesis protein CcmH